MTRSAAVRASVFLIFVGLAATNGPSPLYPIYQHEYRFSAFVLTATFVAYQVGVLLTLLGVGSLSDRIGRKPVLVGAAVLLVVSIGIYGAVQGVVWILAARFLQGIALGNIGSAGTAALVDASPGRDRSHASLLSTLAFTAGAGSGSLMFGVFAQYLPWPTRLPYVMVGSAALAGVWLALRAPETLPGAGTDVNGPSPWRQVAGSVRLQRPVAPRAILRPLVAAFCTVGVAFSVSGIYAALSPSMVAQLLHDDNHAVAASVLLVFWVCSGIGQLVSRGRSSRAVMVAGLLSTVAGIGMLQLGVMDASDAFFGGGAMLSGLGFGLAFVGSLALVAEVAPADQRAEVVSTYNIAGYVAVAVPIVGVGALANLIGLKAASGVFALVVSAVALVSFALLARLPAPGLVAERELT